MNVATLLGLVANYGPSIIPLVQKLVKDIEAGRGNSLVTSADLDELARLAKLDSSTIYAKLGITLPPSA